MTELHRVNLSDHWQPTADGTGLQRKFGCPVKLTRDERAWLHGTGWHAGTAITVNGLSLVADEFGSFECDITSHLQPRNVITVLGETQGELAMIFRKAA